MSQAKATHSQDGPHQQLNVKATGETIDRIYRLADEKKVPLGELLQLDVDALDRERPSRN